MLQPLDVQTTLPRASGYSACNVESEGSGGTLFNRFGRKDFTVQGLGGFGVYGLAESYVFGGSLWF